jgi:hypothetical protein
MVRVEIRTQGEWLASDWRWVNDVDFQQSEGTSYFGIPAPTLRAFVEQGREHGVLNALRAIYEESPNALIHFLKQFDLSYFYRQVEAQAPIVVLPGVATAPLAEDEEKGEAPQDFTVPNLGLLKAHPFAELARWARRRLKRVLSHFDPLSPEFDVRRFWNAALESNDILVWMYHKGIGDAFDEGNETIAQTLHENLGGFLDGLPKSKPPLSGLGVRAPDLKRGALAHFTCMVMLAEYVLESTEYLIQVDPEDREDFDRNQFLLLDKASRVISGHAWPGISKVTELKPEMDRLKRSFGLELRMKGVAAFGSYLQELAKYGEGGGPPRAKVFVCPACDRSQTFKRRDRCRICLSQFCQDCARSCENCSPRKELTAIRSQLDR